jgi:hypothetical protein
MYRPDLFYEVTSMTAGGRHFLRPCEESTDLYIGVVGRALHHYDTVKIYALNPLSTHSTEVISAKDPDELDDYLCFVKTNLAKELRRLHGIDPRESIFERRRARVIPIAPTRRSLEGRFRYCMSQGTKENLVASPRDWKGVSGAVALETNTPLKGTWYDRTAESAARRRRGQPVDPMEFATTYPVRFSPLPFWEQDDEAAWRRRVTKIIDDIALTAAEERKRTGKTVLGFEAVARTPPMFVGAPPEKSPAPRLHAIGKRAFETLKRVVVSFVNAYCAESELCREDPEREPQYPPFAFPPRGPMTRPDPDAQPSLATWALGALESFD